MCGIFAVINRHSHEYCGWTKEGLKLLRHRGPDKTGTLRVSLPWATVTLGMTRLKITDQSDLPVPVGYDGVFMAYNGEIYNHRELRAELGVMVSTECDSELLCRGIAKVGLEKLLPMLNGMFSFVAVDTAKGCVYIARDRAGEKPLYYTTEDFRFYAASEIKALPVALWEEPCQDLETFEFDWDEQTAFQKVRRLRPGCYARLDKLEDIFPQCLPVRRWWTLPFGRDDRFTKTEEAAEELEPILRDAVEIRGRTEVPIAVQLSGGLDSSIIQALLKLPSAYTVTFPADGIDNLEQAKKAACGAQPVPVTFDLASVRAALKDIAYHLDTPATWTAVAQWFMMKAISESGHRVCISGEGADELFLGYSRYRILWHLWQCRIDKYLEAYQPLGKHLLGTDTDIMTKVLDRGGTMESEARAREVVHLFNPLERSLPRAMAHIDFHSTMQVLLRMADRMASAWSVENRSPFLDYRVMEFGARLPAEICFTEDGNKAVLRALAGRLGVPWPIVHERTKKGLFIPWTKWTGGAPSSRGIWGRKSFFDEMLAAWREAFKDRLARPACCEDGCPKID